MAVIAKFVVVRDGVELEQTFSNKKDAEAFDSLLDAAQGLASLIKQGDLQIHVDPETIDEISLYFAKNAPAVMKILKPVKPIKSTSNSAGKSKSQPEPKADKDQPLEPRVKVKTKAA